MDKQQCKQCQYYVQHYALDKRQIFRVYCGHCTFFGARRKLPHAGACENFIPGIDDSEAFASKEYLSKELLEYVLSLDLLPPIEEKPVSSTKKRGG